MWMWLWDWILDRRWKNFFFFFLWGKHEWGEEQKERERESQANSMLSAEPSVGLDLTTL